MIINKENERRLFFIIGVGRSGTTLLQEIMCTFEDFCNLKESIIWNDHPFSCWTPVRKSNDFSLLEKFIEENWTARFFVEKTPDSCLCLPALQKRFPDANYIFLERNPFNVVLSQVNKFPEDEDYWVRPFHIQNLIMDESDKELSNEHYWAKATLKLLQQMVLNKNGFKNKIIIKYENLVKDLDSQLEILEKTFGIKKDLEKAKEVIKKPSLSSVKNKYDKTSLLDNEAMKMVREAQKLLGYTQI